MVDFLRGESGGIAVEWVLATGLAAGLCLGVLALVGTGAGSGAEEIGAGVMRASEL